MNEHMDQSNQPLGIEPGLSFWLEGFPLAHYFPQDMRFRVHIVKNPIANSGWAWITGKIPKITL